MVKNKRLNTFTSALVLLCCQIMKETAHANNRCTELLSSSSSTSSRENKAKTKEAQTKGAQTKEAQAESERTSEKTDETEGLIAYLGALLERQIIGDTELLRFIKGLERDEISNPIPEENTWVSSAALIHREGIEAHIKRAQLNPKKLLEWSKQSLKEKKRVRVRREETREETQDIFQKIELHPVQGGRFQMGEFSMGGALKNVNLTHPIKVMSTPVTQKQWVEVMGENSSRFTAGKHSIVVNLNGKSIEMQPDNPVESVTWWSAIVFANRLSEKYGFKPAYDLSGITWKQGTRAEDGNLAAGSENGSGKIKINTNGGVHDPYSQDIYYQAEGFRLPTEAEQEFMLRAAGTANGKYYFRNNKAELKDHAWYDENSNGKTHPVAQLKPFIVDGKDFYDLHGNVWEWGWDWYSKNLKGGNNPVGVMGGPGRILRGSSWDFTAFSLLSGSRFKDWPHKRKDTVGFRLVRTVINPSDAASDLQ